MQKLKKEKKEKQNTNHTGSVRASGIKRHPTPISHIVLYPLGKPFWPPATDPEVFDLQGGMETTPVKEEASPPGIISNITIPDRSSLGTARLVEYSLSVFWGIYPTCLYGIVVNIS